MSPRFASSFDNPADAREFVRAALTDRPQGLVWTAALLTSEVVTNALVHAGTLAALVLLLDADCVRIEVVDLEPTTELVPLDVALHSEHGRGLAIVDKLSSSWGVERRPPGKAVWFELRIT